jgi:hypothetical protein
MISIVITIKDAHESHNVISRKANDWVEIVRFAREAMLTYKSINELELWDSHQSLPSYNTHSYY